MPTFAWEGKARSGETRRGTIEAATEDMVLARLKAEQIAVTRLRKQAASLADRFAIGSPVSQKDIVIFTRQFGTMIDAGLPLVQCLDILSTQSENKRFGKILADVKHH